MHCKDYHVFLSILIKFFPQSLQYWRKIQVRHCFRKTRIYKDPRVAHLPTPRIKPTSDNHSELVNPSPSLELCCYSTATQWRVSAKAPHRRTGARIKNRALQRTFSLESKVRRRQEKSAVQPFTAPGRCKETCILGKGHTKINIRLLK